MTNRMFWSCFTFCIVFSIVNKFSDGYKVVEHDLDVAASDKHEWEKGDDEDHYYEEHDEKGEKGKKGYKGEHG